MFFNFNFTFFDFNFFNFNFSNFNFSNFNFFNLLIFDFKLYNFNNINKKRKSLLIKYNEKLINIDLKIFQFIKQNALINNLKLLSNNIVDLKNENSIKLLKLYSLKSKIN